MRSAMLALSVAAALVVSACGSSSKTTPSSSSSSAGSSAPAQTNPQAPADSGTGASSVSFSADPSGQLKFNTTQATAKAGKVMLELANPASVPHGLSLEGNGLDKEGKVIQQGGKSTLTIDVKPGTYTFYCPVPGHRQAGMQGMLVVR